MILLLQTQFIAIPVTAYIHQGLPLQQVQTLSATTWSIIFRALVQELIMELLMLRQDITGTTIIPYRLTSRHLPPQVLRMASTRVVQQPALSLRTTIFL